MIDCQISSKKKEDAVVAVAASLEAKVALVEENLALAEELEVVARVRTFL